MQEKALSKYFSKLNTSILYEQIDLILQTKNAFSLVLN